MSLLHNFYFLLLPGWHLDVSSNSVFGHQDNPIYLTRSPRVVVISYTMLHRLRKNMLELEWALLIVDESHHVRCTKKTEPGEVCRVSIVFLVCKI